MHTVVLNKQYAVVCQISCVSFPHSAHLVPVYSFGENEVFDQVQNPKGTWLRWIQDRLQSIMGISLPLFHARGVFQYSIGVIPYRKPINTVSEWKEHRPQTICTTPAIVSHNMFTNHFKCTIEQLEQQIPTHTHTHSPYGKREAAKTRSNNM